MKGDENHIHKLITDLDQYQSLRGRNISMGRLYTSFKIENRLLDRQIIMIEKIKVSRVGIPPVIKAIANQDENSYLLFW